MKSPHHSLPKPTAEIFFFVLKLSNSWTQIWTSWDYSFIHTSFHSVFLQLWQMSPHSTCPCFRLHRERVQKESCCKNNCKPTASQLLSKEIQHTNLGFAYFCGVEGNFSFPSMLPKHSYSLARQKSSGWWDSACWRSSSFQESTHWNPPTCFLPALNESGIRAPATSVHGCVTLKLWGRHSFPSAWLPPRTHFQQQTTHSHSSPASTQGGYPT